VSVVVDFGMGQELLPSITAHPASKALANQFVGFMVVPMG